MEDYVKEKFRHKIKDISKVKTLSKIKLDYDEGDQVYLKLKGEGPWRGPGTVKGRQEGNTVWVHHNAFNAES